MTDSSVGSVADDTTTTIYGQLAHSPAAHGLEEQSHDDSQRFQYLPQGCGGGGEATAGRGECSARRPEPLDGGEMGMCRSSSVVRGPGGRRHVGSGEFPPAGFLPADSRPRPLRGFGATSRGSTIVELPQLEFLSYHC